MRHPFKSILLYLAWVVNNSVVLSPLGGRLPNWLSTMLSLALISGIAIVPSFILKWYQQAHGSKCSALNASTLACWIVLLFAAMPMSAPPQGYEWTARGISALLMLICFVTLLLQERLPKHDSP